MKALKFLGWSPSSVASKVEAPRHEVAGALLIQSRAPRAADLSTLDGYSILEYDMGHDQASTVAHTLDLGAAFGVEYNTFDVWRAARDGIMLGMRSIALFGIDGASLVIVVCRDV